MHVHTCLQLGTHPRLVKEGDVWYRWGVQENEQLVAQPGEQKREYLGLAFLRGRRAVVVKK